MLCKKKTNSFDLFAILIILILAGCYVARSFMGVCQSDEAFYIALADRLWKGDLLLIDEWHPSQLIGFVNYPLYALYRLIAGGTDGIFLYFRLVHVAISLVVSIAWYKTFSDRGRVGAFLSSILYLSYARSSIDGINYYKVSVTCLVLIIVLLVRVVEHRERKIEYFTYEVLIGICLAYEVVSMPFMVIGIIVAGIYLAASLKIDLRTIWTDILRVVVGITIVAIAFCQCAISWNIVSAIEGIGHLFSEPGHNRGFVGTIYDGLFTIFAYGKLIPIFLGLLSIIILTWNRRINKFDKNRMAYNLFAVSLALDDIYLVYRNCFIAEEGFECFDLIFCAIPILGWCIFAKERADVKLTVILGIVLALCYFIGSNTGLSAACNGAIVITMGLLLYIPGEIELREVKTGIKYLILFEMASIVVLTVFKHSTFIYRDSNLKELKTIIREGPYKGLYTSEKQAVEINEIMETVNALNDVNNSSEEKKGIIVSRKIPWIYMAVNSNCSSPTVWDVPMNDERIVEWNEQNSDRRPDTLILVSEDVGGTQFNYQEFIEMPYWNLIEDTNRGNNSVRVYNISY